MHAASLPGNGSSPWLDRTSASFRYRVAIHPSQSLHVFDHSSSTAQPWAERQRRLARLCRAFTQATGWELVPSGGANHGEKDAPLHVDVEGPPIGEWRIDRQSAVDLATELSHLWSEVHQTQALLWQREAELATAVPVVERADEPAHLAARLEMVLKAGAEAVGCSAAALYLLNDETQQLHLRSVWNLPRDRFTQPARNLRDATADLEALCGHAIALEHPAAIAEWEVPERTASAVCVPVSSPTTPLGTLWLFSHEPRPFTDQEVNLAEVVAGRLAADLEREVLLTEGHKQSHVVRQLADAERLQQNQLPRVAPLARGWEVASWTEQSGRVGGDFHDWLTLPDQRLLFAVADCLDGGLDAALSAAGVRAAFRSHAEHVAGLDQLLERVNSTLWNGSAGDQYANMACILLDPMSGRFWHAAAGHTGTVLLTGDGWQSLGRPRMALGLEPSTRYAVEERFLGPGEVLVLFTDGVRDATDMLGRPWGEIGLAQAIVPALDHSADRLARILRERLTRYAAQPKCDDRTVLVLKRSE